MFLQKQCTGKSKKTIQNSAWYLASAQRMLAYGDFVNDIANSVHNDILICGRQFLRWFPRSPTFRCLCLHKSHPLGMD